MTEYSIIIQDITTNINGYYKNLDVMVPPNAKKAFICIDKFSAYVINASKSVRPVPGTIGIKINSAVNAYQNFQDTISASQLVEVFASSQIIDGIQLGGPTLYTSIIYNEATMKDRWIQINEMNNLRVSFEQNRFVPADFYDRNFAFILTMRIKFE